MMKISKNISSHLMTAIACVASLLPLSQTAQAWAPKKAPLMTKWAAQVNPKNPLPEYPRPQLVRRDWLNLNGVWEYEPGKEGDSTPFDKKLNSEILVPFAVESALSGVMEHHDRLWYRRNFTVPANWKNKQVKINFGAVDYESEVFVNGQSVGVHRGGYESFSYNITPYLKATGPQEIIVRVFDPTDKAGQPRGKQSLSPVGIIYTPTTGIWQTVWLEPVATNSIEDLHMVPDIDAGTVKVRVKTSSEGELVIKVKDGKKVIQTVTASSNRDFSIPIPNAKLWSPDSPFLYDIEVSLRDGGKEVDKVTSYFGMRKISVGPVDGIPKLLLNNKFVFQFGPLDQGFWPDGIYTAPTDEALKYDLEMTKQLGFNMTRKHIKVEPARWYYHADKLGLLVWQDLPSANSYISNPPPLDEAAYEKQMESIITTHWNSPAIVMWVIFNEGQGRHKTRYLTDKAKSLDPSRLTNRDSGAGDEKDGDSEVGDVDDVHHYSPPACPTGTNTNQALACGEYGGVSYTVKGHTYKGDGWGYSSVPGVSDLQDIYGEFTEILQGFHDKNGLSAAVYTQITDVESEVNGLMTYDRILKVDPKLINLANHFNYAAPSYKVILPTSEETPQTWKYSTTAPAAGWNLPGFDASAWQTGNSAFGSSAGTTPRLETNWESDDIWLLRSFNPGSLTAEQIGQLSLRCVHDDDLEVYINGVLALKLRGANSKYGNNSMTEEAKKAIKPNAANVLAVHCKETGGDQFVDVGISQRIPAKP